MSRPIERESVTAGDADRAAALAEGLSELELPFRATLELRYRRGLPDSTIAAVALLDESEIVRQRSRALVWLAQRAGIEGSDAIDAVERGLTLLWADPVAPAEPEPEPEPKSQTEQMPLAVSIPPPMEEAVQRPLPQPRPFPTTPSSRSEPKSFGGSNRRLPALLALAAAVAVVLIIVTSGGSNDSTAPAPGGGAATPTTTNATKPDQSSRSDAVAMQMLPGVDLSGHIDVTTSGDPAQPDLDVKLHGLPDPDGEYRAWLYRSVIDSRSLGRARKGDGEVRATLPENWQDYDFIDLSIQDPGSIAHSGESVARISLDDLPQP